jgi:3-hydroxyacyl-[acyl-carrier-protein] dehydratase
MRILPHRGGMLLMDEVTLDEDGAAVATYKVRGDEFFFDGHFPGNPVMPGVILCEIMAQTCCILLEGQKGVPMYTGLNKVKFKNPVRPGDVLKSTARITKRKRIFYFAEGRITANGSLCFSGEFSFAVLPEQKKEDNDDAE